MSSKHWVSWVKRHFRSNRSTPRRRVNLLSPVWDWLLEDRCLPSGGPPYEFPALVGTIDQVMYNGVTGQYEKTITITNNSQQTVYAFLEGQISRPAISPYEGTGAFDPFDDANQEYRAYIGYTDDSDPNNVHHYAGLPPQSSITIPVPLAFWDSGRINFSTDGADQFQSAPGAAAAGAPFYFHTDNTQAGFYCYVDAAHLDRLYFQPIYNSFDPSTGYMPSTKDWKSPVELGLLKTGMSVNVPGNSTITVDPSHLDYVTLNQPAANALPVQQFVFTSAGSDTISPTDRVVTTGYSLTTPEGTSTDGAVMWYHALKANLPNNDAPFQLTEVTFRGSFYNPAINTTTGFQYLLGNDPGNGIAANDFDLADYDVSFVDAINMPNAMEATDAGIPQFRNIAVGNATETGNTVTITTTVPHGFSAGQVVYIAGFSGPDAGYNGAYTILSSGLTPTTFEYTSLTTGLPTSTTAGNASTTTPAPFGWVGTSQPLDAFQKVLADFTSTNPSNKNVNGLGEYFGGKGYPSYYPVDPSSLKLPSGQNLFLASPVAPVPLSDIFYVKTFNDGSSIKQPVYALTTAGDGPALLGIGGDVNVPSSGKNLALNQTTQANVFILNDLIAPNVEADYQYQVQYTVYENGQPTNTVVNDTVVGLYKEKGTNKILGVELAHNVQGQPGLQSYTFTLPPTDYVGKAIASIWYSWANYYATSPQVKNSTPLTNVTGTVSAGSENILVLDNAAPGLVPGMAVTSSALPGACIILAITPDGKTITLSTTAAVGSNSFSFTKPAVTAIAGYDPNPKGFTPLLKGFSFGGPDQATALAFAETVYVVMSAWSVSVPTGPANGWNTLLGNIIGGNLGTGFLPNANADVVKALTFKSKSLLRGVPDYTSPLYSDPAQWYPDPALSTGGQKFNVYNLDPFVWFIHEKLAALGYSFALDDDLGNVGAFAATHVSITVGGLGGVPNTDPYAAVSPFGVVTTKADAAPAQSSVLTNLTNPDIARQISQFDYPHNMLGTMVNGQGMQMGTTLQIATIDNDHPEKTKLTLSRPLSSATTASTTYSFFAPLVFTAKVLGAGQAHDTLYLDSLDAYNTLLKLGPLQNIQVNGPGIPFGTTVTIKSLPPNTIAGVYQVQLDSKLQANLVSQPGSSYGYTFGNPVVGTVRDEGFEWAVVKGLVDDLDHGTQVSNNTHDWTFTDADPDPNSHLHAGIVFNASPFISGQPAPQGLQAAFITGTSSISQTVTLGAGTYTLSFRAAQRANQQIPQSLQVLVGTKSVLAKPITGTNYTLYTTQSFTVAAGTYTITFQGMQNSDSTVLLDEVSIAAKGTQLTAVGKRFSTRR